MIRTVPAGDVECPFCQRMVPSRRQEQAIFKLGTIPGYSEPLAWIPGRAEPIPHDCEDIEGTFNMDDM